MRCVRQWEKEDKAKIHLDLRGMESVSFREVCICYVDYDCLK